MSCDKKGKVTIKKLKELMKEEKESSKEYRRLGFKSQANDEAKHSKFFKKKIAELKKKKTIKKKRIVRRKK